MQDCYYFVTQQHDGVWVDENGNLQGGVGGDSINCEDPVDLPTLVSTKREAEQESQLEQLLARKLENFKGEMTRIQNEAIRGLYTDALPYVLTDTQYNISSIVEDCLDKFINNRFDVGITEHGYYSIKITELNGFTHNITANCHSVWDNIVKTIFEHNREAIVSTRITQLEAQLEMLKDQLNRGY